MHDTSPVPPQTTVEWSTIRVDGDDASTFLQGQLTADVSARAAQTLLLTPASIVLCGASLSYDSSGILLTVRSEVSESAHARLRRFVLLSKCSFEIVDAIDVPYRTVGEQVDAGLPGPQEYRHELTPHSYGAGFVGRHISFTKGCFTGQELVGRLDARGANVPFRLVQFWSPTLAQAEGVIMANGPLGGAQGVTTAVEDESGVRGLAFVHRTTSDRVTGEVRLHSVTGEA